jgi:hypothetical protein
MGIDGIRTSGAVLALTGPAKSFGVLRSQQRARQDLNPQPSDP